MKKIKTIIEFRDYITIEEVKELIGDMSEMIDNSTIINDENMSNEEYCDELNEVNKNRLREIR